MNINKCIELIENSIDSNVSAIMAVHMHGNMCDMNKLKYLAKKYNLKLIEDCAQAYMSYDELGNIAGSYGDVAAFSFNPMKILGGLGDGGAVVFDDYSFVYQLRRLRHLGINMDGDYVEEFSRNCRLDSVHARFLGIRMTATNHLPNTSLIIVALWEMMQYFQSIWIVMVI